MIFNNFNFDYVVYIYIRRLCVVEVVDIYTEYRHKTVKSFMSFLLWRRLGENEIIFLALRCALCVLGAFCENCGRWVGIGWSTAEREREREGEAAR